MDEQLQTRLLVAELEEYSGRIKRHTRAFSKLLLPDYATADNAEIVSTWRAALRSLTTVRRTVFPLDHEEFALDNDEVPHGARLWANLLGLMCAHGFLEQRNREIVELPSGEVAVVVTPDDYEAAYEIFEATAQRTVTNLSGTHRKILDAVHDLQVANPDADGFSQRMIAETAGIRQGTVSKQKTFLVTSARLLRETDHGLALVSGAEPGWWETDAAMRGFPTPEQVKVWWNEHLNPWDQRNIRNVEDHQPSGEERSTHNCAENGQHDHGGHPEIEQNHRRRRDSQDILGDVVIENGSSEPRARKDDEYISHVPVIPGSTSSKSESPPSDLDVWEEV